MSGRRSKRGPRLADERDAAIGPPALLDGVALEEWNRMAPELTRNGALNERSRAALAAYCQTYARWTQAEQEILETGAVVTAPSGYPIQNPWLAIANKAQEQMRQFMNELGMTPKSAKKVKLAAASDDDDDELARAFG